MSYNYLRPGIGNAASYQAAGIPWYTSSLAPALSTTSVVVNLPQVTKFVTIKNTSTTGDSLRFTFNNDSVVDNTNYVLLESGESFSADFRVTDIHLISDTETPVPFTIVNGLTNIKRQEMTSTTPVPPNLLAWAQKQKILADDPDGSPEGDLFGFRVICATDDLTKLFVSALQDEQEEAGDYAGSIYVFEEIEGQYVQVQVIEVPPELYESYAFMQPIAVSSDGTRLLTSNNTNKWAVFESGSGGYNFMQQLPIDKSAHTSGPANVGSFVGNDKIFFGSTIENEAYVFHSGSGGYQLVQTLTASYDTTGAPEALADRGFGVSLFADAIGDLVFVGALNDDENGTPNAGAVYVFQSSSLGYNQVQKLTASFNTDGTPESSPQGDQFGSRISITPDGRVIAISADNDDEKGPSAGSVYIYESGSTGYQQIQKITASADSDPSFDYFGFSISLDSVGETLVVGVPHDDAAGGDNTMFSGAGSVYIFKFDGSSFKQQEKLLPTEEPNPEANLFGYSLFLDKTGTRLIIGSANDEENGGSNDAFSGAGSAYIFKYTRDY